MTTVLVESKKKEMTVLLGLALVACTLLVCVDAFAPVPYLYKAMGKAVLFVGFPLLYWRCYPHFSYKPLFRLEKKALKLAVLLGVLVIVVILGAYFLTTSFVDLSAVVGELDTRLQIDSDNFVIVAVYIALCNSFLEEFFFRGFLFFRLKAITSAKFAHVASATLFSLYHIGIMVTWFQWWVFALCMLALVIGGVIFNYLDESTESLYPSWLTHGCGNVALNTIGMILMYG